MSFTVLLHPEAARSLKKVQASVRSRILASMKELGLRPEKGDRLKPSHFWRLRVGDYRVVCEIDRSRKRVIVLYLGHRKNVYDELKAGLGANEGLGSGG